jgi:hypothetical protein
LAILWITYEPRGLSVAFTEEAWAHILYEHPDLSPWQGAIKSTVEDPDVCTKELDESLNYYRREVVPKALGKYLHVLVRPTVANGADLEIHTAWPTDFVDAFEERLI